MTRPPFDAAWYAFAREVRGDNANRMRNLIGGRKRHEAEGRPEWVAVLDQEIAALAEHSPSARAELEGQSP